MLNVTIMLICLINALQEDIIHCSITVSTGATHTTYLRSLFTNGFLKHLTVLNFQSNNVTFLCRLQQTCRISPSVLLLLHICHAAHRTLANEVSRKTDLSERVSE